MSYGGSVISDYVRDVPMEIDVSYFPLPAVFLNEHSTVEFPLDALDEEYDFSSECKAVEDFKHSEDRRQRLETEREKQLEESRLKKQLPSKNPSEDSPVSSADTTNDEESVKNWSSNGLEGSEGCTEIENPVSSQSPVKLYSSTPLVPIQDILQPQPLQKKVHHRRKSSGSQKLSLLEDFEPTTSASPFDALAIKTMNDREILRQILDPSGTTCTHPLNGVYSGAEEKNLEVSAKREDSQHNWNQNRNVQNDSSSLLNRSWQNSIGGKPVVSTETCGNSWPANSNPFLSASQETVVKPVSNINGYTPGFLFSSNSDSSQRVGLQFSAADRRQQTVPMNLELPRNYRVDSYAANNPSEQLTPLKPSTSSPDLTELAEEARKMALRDVPNDSLEIPLAVMNDSERRMVDSISPLGFLPAQVLRCVRRMQTSDRGKLVETLLLIRSLCQNDLDTELVEEAVFYSQSDAEKARQFIRAAVQLQGLGFEDPKIFSALKLCRCSRDKALDYLLTNG